MTSPEPTPAVGPGLRQEVLDWFVRRHREVWSAEDEATFAMWLVADARHRDAYAQWSSRWQMLDAVPADTVAALRRTLQRGKALHARPAAPAGAAPARPDRRALLIPAFSVAALAVVAGGTGYAAWSHLQAQPVFAQAFGTQRGQQLEVPLPDGSRLRLDTATRLEVTYYRQRREVRLLEGQAVFSVQGDAARPFHVLAGGVRVTVVGTRFAVRHTPAIAGAEDVTVSVEEGKVRVAREDAAAEDIGADAVDLAAGQQVTSDRRGTLAAVTAVPREGIAPWREHRISFVDTPLARALAELDRYANTGLVVRDPVVAQLRLTGTFDPRDAATLARLLPRALPVRLLRTGNVTEVVQAR